jgi:pimeloyl-ACP methyl ester carboxylesterase
VIAVPAAREQTRARYPDEEGYVERDGVRLFYEVYGEGAPTVFLLPTWSIIHSRHWKAQIPYLARHFRVLTLDGRGNGKSGRPDAPEAYAEREFAADALAVLDETGTEQAVLVSLSAGAVWSTILAAEQPERVTGMVCIAPAAPFAFHARRELRPFDEPIDDVDGWAKWNRHYWRENYPDFVEFFFGECFTEAHSTKQIEDTVGWGLDTDPETLAATVLGWTPLKNDPDVFRPLCRRVRCPVLVVHGTADAIRPQAAGEQMAAETGGEVVLLEGSGHLPHARDPVRVNILIREFAESIA